MSQIQFSSSPPGLWACLPLAPPRVTANPHAPTHTQVHLEPSPVRELASQRERLSTPDKTWLQLTSLPDISQATIILWTRFFCWLLPEAAQKKLWAHRTPQACTRAASPSSGVPRSPFLPLHIGTRRGEQLGCITVLEEQYNAIAVCICILYLRVFVPLHIGTRRGEQQDSSTVWSAVEAV